jgi:hypothetical protein
MATDFVRDGFTHINGLDNFVLPKAFTKIVLSISSLRLTNQRKFSYCINDINSFEDLKDFLNGVIDNDDF